MAATVCSVCEQFAATTIDKETNQPLCGNCAMLSPAERAKVIKTKEANAKINAGTLNPGAAVAEMQQKHANLETLCNQLKAENDKLADEVRVRDKQIAELQKSHK